MPGEIIFLTGGTGSFGQGFTAHVLRRTDAAMIRIFSRDEHKQREMREKFKERVSFFIGDVRDEERLADAMEGSHWVVHAAALKQAPIGEIEPQEFIKTNILGSMNVVRAARRTGVLKSILISTDKAVEPVNLYGATKMCAEKIFLQADKMRGTSVSRFACTRYGNVAGTSGSIIPVLKALDPREPAVIYDQEATRFWITLKEANAFVFDSLGRMSGGETFVPKIKSVRIADVIEAVRPGMPVITGKHRPGDKTHEVLSINGSRYQSDKNEFMTIQEIRDAMPTNGMG